MQELILILKLFSDNVHVLGWAAVIFTTFKLSWKISRFFDNIIESATRVRKMQDTIESLATNHLPHIEKEIIDISTSVKDLKEDLVTEIRGLRNDLFQLALKKD